MFQIYHNFGRGVPMFKVFHTANESIDMFENVCVTFYYHTVDDKIISCLKKIQTVSLLEVQHVKSYNGANREGVPMFEVFYRANESIEIFENWCITSYNHTVDDKIIICLKKVQTVSLLEVQHVKSYNGANRGY